MLLRYKKLQVHNSDQKFGEEERLESVTVHFKSHGPKACDGRSFAMVSFFMRCITEVYDTQFSTLPEQSRPWE